MKKLSVSLSLLSSCFVTHSANALSGSSTIVFSELGAFGSWGKYSPLDVTEGGSDLPDFDAGCKVLYGSLRGTSGYLTYDINEFSGFVSGTLNYLGRTMQFSGGAWKRQFLPPIRVADPTEDPIHYSLAQTSTLTGNNDSENLNPELLKVQYFQPWDDDYRSMIIVSLVFSGPEYPAMIPLCYLFGLESFPYVAPKPLPSKGGKITHPRPDNGCRPCQKK